MGGAGATAMSCKGHVRMKSLNGDIGEQLAGEDGEGRPMLRLPFRTAVLHL